MEFEIFNSSGDLIKVLESHGFGEVKVGAYNYSAWLENNNGSKDNDAARKSNIIAVKMALKQLLAQLEENSKSLSKQLAAN